MTNPASWSQATWFIDPQNVSGLASDANSGIDATHPVLTYNGGVVAQWGTVEPLLAQDTTMTWMSPQTDGDPSDPVILKPVLAGALLLLSGTLDVAQNRLSSGTLSSVTAKNRTTPQLLQADLGATVPVGSLVINKSPGKESTCFVYKNVTGTVYALTQPLWFDSAQLTLPIIQQGSTTSWQMLDTWANGDTFEVWAPMAVNIVKLEPTVASYVPPDWPSQLQAQYIRFMSVGGVEGDNCWVGNDVSLADCCIDSCFTNLMSLENEVSVYANCFMQGGAYNTTGASFLQFMFAGALISTSTASTVNWGMLDLGVILDSTAFAMNSGYGITVGGTQLMTGDHAAIGEVYIDGNMNASGQLDAAGGNQLSGASTLWGPGRMQVVANARVIYDAAAGAAGTFLQKSGITINGNAYANAFDRVSGAWSAGIAITPASIDTPFGSGGFGGNCVNPGGGCVVSHDWVTNNEGGPDT